MNVFALHRSLAWMAVCAALSNAQNALALDQNSAYGQAATSVPHTITFEEVPIQQNLKKLVVDDVTFSCRAPCLEIKQKTLPGEAISGRHLYQVPNTGIFQITPPAPVGSVSFDLERLNPNENIGWYFLIYDDNSVDRFSIPVGVTHYSNSAAVGKLIKEVFFELNGANIDNITLDSPTALPPPNVPTAQGDKVDLSTLGDNLEVTYDYPGMAIGDSVGMRWTGSTPHYDAQVQHVTKLGHLSFLIPKRHIAGDAGRTASLTASVGVGDNPLIISAPKVIQVIGNGNDNGAATAARLNNRYLDTADTCPGNQPAYYCNGIIIRSVDNGNFNPWDPSPSAEKLGAVSFSYFRVDSHVANFYRNAGFIFLPQTEAAAQGKAMEYLCIYAYDAGTIVGTRSGKGCGLKPRNTMNADLSTCTSQNATTVNSWYTFTRSLPNRDYQCSLSTQDAAQFAVSYKVRANRPTNMEALWNEMMVSLWPQGYGNRLPIEAFFYKAGNGVSRSDARTFQAKFKNSTGTWVPVIALDLNKLSGPPFSYIKEDQAVQP